MIRVALLVAVGFGSFACAGSSSTSTTQKPQTTSVDDVVFRAVELQDGTNRRYGAFVPPEHPGPMPAVIVLNFVGSTYSAADPPAKLAVAARQHGFITVVPESVEASWNAGTCCGAAVARSVDDPQFLRLLVEDLPDAVPVDPNRVYLVGYSNGGMLAASMICRGAPGVAGVALVEATLLQARCDGAQPVDLLQIHQTEDEVVPFAGTTTSKLATDGVLPSVTDAFGRLSTALGCEPNSSAPLRTEGVTTESRACADGTRAMLVVIEGGSHAWPDGVAVPVDATSLIVEVFDLETVGRPIS